MYVYDTRIERNQAVDDGGGGIFNDGGDLHVEVWVLDRNSATGAAGGGVFNGGPAEVAPIEDSDVTRSVASTVGGVFTAASATTDLEGATFASNVRFVLVGA